jgi:hypothetical protein
MADPETTLPFGAWRSPITSDLIVGESIGLGDILVDGGDIYWIEGRPGEGGRNVVVRCAPGGAIADVTPAPFNARTRVHEYGGGAATVHEGRVFFSNFADQRLYQQVGAGTPTPLTPAADPARPLPDPPPHAGEGRVGAACLLNPPPRRRCGGVGAPSLTLPRAGGAGGWGLAMGPRFREGH